MNSTVSALFNITKHFLGIYRTKQARTYLARTIYLEKMYYDEDIKPESEQNHALMDNITAELRIISNNCAKFGLPNFED